MTDDAGHGRARVLTSFERALSVDAHNLTQWPRLVWQQLYNELQWEEPVRPLLETVAGARSGPAWMHRTTPIAQTKELKRTIPVHTPLPSTCAFSADGELLFVGGLGTSVLKAWDVRTGEERLTLSGAVGIPNACAVSPDGSFVVAGGFDRTLWMWDAATGQELGALTKHPDAIQSCAVSPDARLIVLGGAAGTLHVWDREKRKDRFIRKRSVGQVMTCAVSPDGKFVVAGRQDGVVGVWDTKRWKERAAVKAHSEWVRSCAVSPDAQYAVTGGNDCLKVWDATRWEPRATLGDYGSGRLAAREERVAACAVSPDGSLIVSGHSDGSLRLWDAQTGEERATLRGHTGAIVACAVSPDGELVATAAVDGTVKIWDARVGEAAAGRGHSHLVTTCVASPDGDYVVSASWDGTLRFWDATTGEERTAVDAHSDWVGTCAVSSDADLVVSAGNDFRVRLWDRHGAPVATVDRLSSDSVAIDPDGAFVVCGTAEGAVTVLRPSGEEIVSLDAHHWFVDPSSGGAPGTGTHVSGRVRTCVVSGDGALVASGSDDRTVGVWDARGWTDVARLTGHREGVGACAFSPDGAWLVSGDDDGTLKVWGAGAWTERATLLGHRGRITTIAFSPDGEFLATASDGQWNDERPIGAGAEGSTLILWDPRTWEERARFQRESSDVVCAVTPDAAFVVSGDGSGVVRVWNALERDEVGTLPLLGRIHSIALHPWLPLVAAGDSTGNVNFVRPIGIEYGPIVVTAVDRSFGPVIRCPACFGEFGGARLGGVAACPTSGCALRLRVNPFVWRRALGDADRA